MKKMMKKMLALMVVMCMFAPMAVSAVTTQSLKVSITGMGRNGSTATVTATSGTVGSSDKLAETVFLLLGSVYNPEWHDYDEAIAGTGGNLNNLWIFDDNEMRNLLLAGWDTYKNNKSGWSTWVDANFSTITGDSTLKSLIGNLDSTVGQLPAANTDYSLNYNGYTVTVCLVETTSGGGTPGGSTPSTPDDGDKNFTDVHDVDHWSETFVDYVVEKGLFSGTGEKTFHPDLTLTRGMVMTVLASYSGATTTGGSTWYEKSMEWAMANGISDGTNPNGSITREQLAVMLWRTAGSPVVEHDLATAFKDADEISVWAVDAMEWAVKNGVMGGRGNGILDPMGQATRAEAAVMLYNFCERV